MPHPSATRTLSPGLAPSLSSPAVLGASVSQPQPVRWPLETHSLGWGWDPCPGGPSITSTPVGTSEEPPQRPPTPLPRAPPWGLPLSSPSRAPQARARREGCSRLRRLCAHHALPCARHQKPYFEPSQREFGGGKCNMVTRCDRFVLGCTGSSESAQEGHITQHGGLRAPPEVLILSKTYSLRGSWPGSGRGSGKGRGWCTGLEGGGQGEVKGCWRGGHKGSSHSALHAG